MDSKNNLSVDRKRSLIKIRHKGNFSFEQAEEKKEKVLSFIRKTGCNKLLVDLTKAYGSISVTDKYLFVKQIEKYYDYNIRIAFLSNEELFSKENARLFETISTNRGVALNVFHKYNDASKWLDI